MLARLRHYRQLNLAVILGVVVAGATLSGALMVGDSVRESLRRMALDRLGHITHVVIPEHLMSDSLPGRLEEVLPDSRVRGAILLQGSASAGAYRASGVNIDGIEPGFADLYPNWQKEKLVPILQKNTGQISPGAAINEALARELNIGAGDDLLVSFARISDVNRDSLYGKKDTDEVVQKLRLTVKAIMADEDMGAFSLSPSQTVPFNVYVPQDQLARALDKRDHINALLIDTKVSDAELESALKKVVTMADLGLKIESKPSYTSLTHDSFFIDDQIAQTIDETAADLQIPILPISTYLANRLEIGDRLVPYSLVSALDLTDPLAQGTEKLQPQPGEIVLNQWTQTQLGAKAGDTVKLTYFAVGAAEKLLETEINLTYKGALPMEGVGADRDLTPSFPGAENADNMNDWDPPFPMDMSLIRDEDEAYWDTYRTAPKAFISEETARKLWHGRFGFYTGYRLGSAPGQDLTQTSVKFQQAFLDRIELATAGMEPLPIRRLSVAASSGATDFSGLFLALSFFLIISACLLVSLFFRLLVENRRREVGILLAVGYPPSKVRNGFLAEGLVLAVIGAAIGVPGGFLYASGVMAGLRDWWDLGTSHLYFYYTPLSLVLGFLITVIVAIGSIWLALRILREYSARELIAGSREPDPAKSARRAKRVMIGALIAAVAMGAGLFGSPTNVGLGFGLGGSLFMAGLALIATRLTDKPVTMGISGTWSMAARNTARQSGRSLVSIALVASAVYVIVAVGLYRHTGEVNPDDQQGGTGGFFLVAESDIPLHYRLDTQEQRQPLSLQEETEALLNEGEVISMRKQGGDDASCLNLFAPRQPRLLGLPDAGKMRGRFAFQSHLAPEGSDPWNLLEQPLEDGAIPVFGDYNSVMWIMKSGLGKDWTVEDEYGREVKLRFVGLLMGSIFQSELIMSESHFRKLYPGSSGYGYFLFASQAPTRDHMAPALEDDLSDYGFDVSTTTGKIERYHAIENTYITIFQLLGGLGLILGTLGLGAIIYRNALERMGEYGVLRAFGFRQNTLAAQLLIENAVVVVLGIGVGSVSALISMAPHLASSHANPSILLLVGTLAGVFLMGMLSSLLAVRKVANLPLLQALRGN